MGSKLSGLCQGQARQIYDEEDARFFENLQRAESQLGTSLALKEKVTLAREALKRKAARRVALEFLVYKYYDFPSGRRSGDVLEELREEMERSAGRYTGTLGFPLCLAYQDEAISYGQWALKLLEEDRSQEDPLLSDAVSNAASSFSSGSEPSVQALSPTVFISYARNDAEAVNRLDQWLQDHNVRVLRDIRDCSPGCQLIDSIKSMIYQSDKVIAVYSQHSSVQDWPTFERRVAELAEENGRCNLIYLVLDDTPLPKYDANRIAILSKARSLKEVGQELLRGITGKSGEPMRYEYNEDEPLVRDSAVNLGDAPDT